MEKPLILFVGFSKIKYVRIIRDIFGDQYSLGCIYSRPAESPFKQDYLAEFDQVFNVHDGYEIIGSLRQHIAAITCTQERDMPLYIEVLQWSGTITPSQAQQYGTLVDKHKMKELVRTTLPHLVPKSAPVAEVLSGTIPLSYPIMVKPSGLAGSSYVSKIENKQELNEFVTATESFIKEVGKNFYQKEVSYICEEFIDGPQYSVNAYITDEGAVTLSPVVRVIPALELGTNDAYSVFQYVTNELSPENAVALKRSVEELVNIFTIKRTSAHFDMVLSSDGWKVFEVGLRIGGHRHSLFEKTHFLNHIANDIRNRLGKSVNVPPQRQSACIVQTAAVNHGMLTSVSYARNVTVPTKVKILEDKIAKIGEEVMPLRNGGGTITRHFVLGPNEHDVVETARALYQNISLAIEET